MKKLFALVAVCVAMSFAVPATAVVVDSEAKYPGGQTPIMLAAMSEYLPAQEIAAYALAGVDVNAKNAAGQTALWLSTLMQNPVTVRTLLKFGADVKIMDDLGWTPLIAAARHSPNPEIALALIKGGSDVNQKVKSGMTPLMAAAQANPNPEVITALIKAGANVNATDDDGSTALMYAAGNAPNPFVLSVLLGAGADPKIKNKAGKSAYDICQDNGYLKGIVDAYAVMLKAK